MKIIIVKLGNLDQANIAFIKKHLNETNLFRTKPITNKEIISRALDALWLKCAKEKQQNNR